MRSLRVMRIAAELQLRHLAVDLFMLFCVIVQPFFIAVTVMYMLRERPGFDPVFVVVGAGLSGLWSVALFDGTWSIQRERWQGTLELLAGTPAPLMLIVAGKLAGSMVFSVGSMALCYVIGAWLFGYDIGVRDPIGFVVSFALGMVSLWSMGMLFAPVGILWRAASRFLNILEYPVYILAGFMFPVLLLPFWLLPVSYALPPFWGALALHGTSSGGLAPSALVTSWLALVGSSVAIVLLARRLFDLVLDRARREGTLALT